MTNHPSAQRIPFIWRKNCVGQWNLVENDELQKNSEVEMLELKIS